MVSAISEISSMPEISDRAEANSDMPANPAGWFGASLSRSNLSSGMDDIRRFRRTSDLESILGDREK